MVKETLYVQRYYFWFVVLRSFVMIFLMSIAQPELITINKVWYILHTLE